VYVSAYMMVTIFREVAARGTVGSYQRFLLYSEEWVKKTRHNVDNYPPGYTASRQKLH
jgi:hypothetical protein